MRNLITVGFLLIIFSCSSKNNDTLILKPGLEKIDSFDSGLSRIIRFDKNGDTLEYSLKIGSQIYVAIHYYKNKPEGFQIDPNSFDSSSTLNYRRDNKGIVFTFQKDIVEKIGYQYLNNMGRVFIYSDSSGIPNILEVWETDNKGYAIKLPGILENKKMKIALLNDSISTADTLLFIRGD